MVAYIKLKLHNIIIRCGFAHSGYSRSPRFYIGAGCSRDDLKWSPGVHLEKLSIRGSPWGAKGVRRSTAGTLAYGSWWRPLSELSMAKKIDTAKRLMLRLGVWTSATWLPATRSMLFFSTASDKIQIVRKYLLSKVSYNENLVSIALPSLCYRKIPSKRLIVRSSDNKGIQRYWCSHFLRCEYYRNTVRRRLAVLLALTLMYGGDSIQVLWELISLMNESYQPTKEELKKSRRLYDRRSEIAISYNGNHQWWYCWRSRGKQGWVDDTEKMRITISLKNS